MGSISFGEEDFLQVTSGTTYSVPKTGGTVSINLETNTDYSLSIPEEHKSWISTVESRAHRQETVTLSISENKDAARTATIQLVDKDGNAFTSIELNQENGKNDNAIAIPSDMESAFPDENFRKYVLSNFDDNKDEIISEEEALTVKRINVDENSIKSLEGIQYFINLEILYCSKNQLSSIDVSKNTALKELWCNQNQISSLDVSKNTALTYLSCYNNEMDSLNVSNCIVLKTLYCYNNHLTNLNISECTVLTTFECHSNQLTSIDVTKNTKLTNLSCSYNNLTSLDVSKNTALIRLFCGYNNLSSLDVSKTSLGYSYEVYPLFCPHTSIKTLYLKNGWTINAITKNRSTTYIDSGTNIVYV